MKIIKLKEAKRYQLHDLFNLFGLDDDQDNKKFQKIIEKLLLIKILKRVKPQKNLIEIDPNWFNYKNWYQFNYVGIFLIDQLSFFVYPKYISDQAIANDAQNNYVKFKQIIKVILKYQNHALKEQFSGSEVNQNFNLLKFTIDLFNNYHQHGLYYSDQIFTKLNGKGPILWKQTISQQMAYWSNQKPIYLNLVTREKNIDQTNLLTKLHQVILSQCSFTLENVLKVLNFGTIIFVSDQISDLGSWDYLVYELELELKSQFINWKQEVLKQMLNYLKKDYDKQNEIDFAFLGTHFFHVIWEHVCATVYQSDLNKTIRDLKLQPVNPLDLDKTLKQIIVKPVWNNVEVNQTLQPDLIIIKKGRVFIYDAKYYAIKFGPNLVKNNPGIQDLKKQYLYELAYQELIQLNNLKLEANGFLFPSDADEDQELGIAKIDLFPWFTLKQTSNLFKLQELKIILKSASQIYAAYLKQ